MRIVFFIYLTVPLSFHTINIKSQTKMATRQATPLTGELLCLGPEPCNITCPSCRTTALSIVARERTTCWHYTAPCCWLLFSCCGKCLNSWADPRDSNHYCSKCGCFLGRYHERKSISE